MPLSGGRGCRSRARCLPAGPDGRQQGGVEPSAMLVGPFEVEVDRHTEIFLPLAHAGVRYAGIEPDVEDVRLLPEGRSVAGGAGGPGREQFRHLALEPGVRALRLDEGGDMIDQVPVKKVVAARLAPEDGDR